MKSSKYFYENILKHPKHPMNTTKRRNSRCTRCNIIKSDMIREAVKKTRRSEY